MPSQHDSWTMEIDEILHPSSTSWLNYQARVELQRSDFYSSKSGRNFSPLSCSPESPSLSRNFYKRKEQIHSVGFHMKNYAQKSMKDPGYYSSSSSIESMTPPNSPIEESFMRMVLENTTRKEQIRIGLKPSERITYYREILPLHNQPGYIPGNEWERMASPKRPLRRPNSSPSQVI